MELIITPWNGPAFLSIENVCAAIAGGNCAILKPSERSPNTTECLRHLLSNIEGIDVFVCPEGEEVSSWMDRVLSIRYDHIKFTGNPTIAAKILARAAPHRTPCTLELGGKSPVIWGWKGWAKDIVSEAWQNEIRNEKPGFFKFGKAVKLATVMKRLCFAKFGFNVGQICVAPDYILLVVDKDEDPDEMAKLLARNCLEILHVFYGSGGFLYLDFCSVMEKASVNVVDESMKQVMLDTVKRSKEGSRKSVISSSSGERNSISKQSLKSNHDFGKLIDLVAFDRVMRLLNDPKIANTTKIVYNNEEPDRARRFVSPTFVINPPPDSLIMREEIFAPVLPIITVKSEHDAITYIQSFDESKPHLAAPFDECRNHPLASYVVSNDKKLVQLAYTKIQTGCIYSHVFLIISHMFLRKWRETLSVFCIVHILRSVSVVFHTYKLYQTRLAAWLHTYAFVDIMFRFYCNNW